MKHSSLVAQLCQYEWKYNALYLFELAHMLRIPPHDQCNQMLKGSHRSLPNMIHTYPHIRSVSTGCGKDYYKGYKRQKRKESLKKGKGREVK